MRLFKRIRQWRTRRRHLAHKRFLKRHKVIYTYPAPDERNWSEAYMRSLKS